MMDDSLPKELAGKISLNQALYKELYFLKYEHSLNMDEHYILHMCGSRNGEVIKIGTALSDYSTHVHTVNEGSVVKIFSHTVHSDVVTDLRFMPNDNRLLLSSSLDGKIMLFDTRQGSKHARKFFGSLSNENGKPITSFDVSPDGKFVCAGTEVVDGNAYILFWDFASTSVLGGYWQSHTDDITKIEFNSKDRNLLATSSSDGLVNIFTIDEENEEDALMCSLNCESAVETIRWVKKESGEESLISVITQTGDVQIWETDGSSPLNQFSRSKIGTALQLKMKDTAYISNVFQSGDHNMFILAGSTFGKGDILRSIAIEGDTLKPISDFPGNKQIVRTSWFDEKDEVLVTGGECCFISVWHPGRVQSAQPLKHPMVPKRKAVSATKPY